MLERILVYERDAFLWLNGGHNAFWDTFMRLYSGQVVWIPCVLLFLFFVFYKRNLKGSLLIVLSIVILITLCDQFSSSICKNYFMRFRPTHHPDFMDLVKTVNGYRGGKYGFISGHATNALGFATFTLLLFRNRLYSVSIVAWGLLMAYSRIYLGVHFISDIVPGIFCGILFGYGCFQLYAFLHRKLLKTTPTPFPKPTCMLVLFILYGTMVGLLGYSTFSP